MAGSGVLIRLSDWQDFKALFTRSFRPRSARSVSLLPLWRGRPEEALSFRWHSFMHAFIDLLRKTLNTRQVLRGDMRTRGP